MTVEDDTMMVGEPTIGYKIKRVREIVGLKQDDLGLRIGVSQQTVSDWERSKMIKKSVLDKIADGLGVTSEAIVNFEEKAVNQFFNCTNTNAGNGTFHNNVPPELVSLFEKFLKNLKENPAE